MKCSKCQFDNPEGILWQVVQLERICPNCNLPNPFHFKFCGGCGHKLEASGVIGE